MKKKVKIIIGAIAVLSAVLIAIFYLCKPVTAETETVLRSDFMDTFTVTGTVKPVNSSYVCAPLSGKTEDIFVQSGTAVQKGETVLKIDDSEAREELKNQIASLELQKKGLQSQNNAARAELTVTRQQLESQLAQVRLQYEQLYGENGNAATLLSIAQQNFTSANIAYWRAYDEFGDSHDPSECAQLSSLESARAVAEQALLETENNQSESTRAYYESTIASYESQIRLLDDSRSSLSESSSTASEELNIQIHRLNAQLYKKMPEAPFDGTIWELLVQKGDYVVENQPLYRIYESDRMEVEADLLDSQAALLKTGDKVSLKLVDGTILEGELTFLSPISVETLSVLGIKENRCKATISAEKLPKQIGAGHQAAVTFSVLLQEQAIQIPFSALVSSTDGYAVYKVENKKAVLQPVKIGKQSSGKVEILEGLEEDETVIINPYDIGIKGGERIRPE
ncbi:MAG: efflux RND transporter periplasmic adaptor subunit [Clostridiales bacterium]|nr:efflux RND transporter periplasmic adaptor subunit [Clostridiales bacterium]